MGVDKFKGINDELIVERLFKDEQRPKCGVVILGVLICPFTMICPHVSYVSRTLFMIVIVF